MKIFNLNNATSDELSNFEQELKKMLVAQAVSQHIEQDGGKERGMPIGYIIDRETETLLIKYENGECWTYCRIDEGADGMIAKMQKQ